MVLLPTMAALTILIQGQRLHVYIGCLLAINRFQHQIAHFGCAVVLGGVDNTGYDIFAASNLPVIFRPCERTCPEIRSTNQTVTVVVPISMASPHKGASGAISPGWISIRRAGQDGQSQDSASSTAVTCHFPSRSALLICLS